MSISLTSSGRLLLLRQQKTSDWSSNRSSDRVFETGCPKRWFTTSGPQVNEKGFHNFAFRTPFVRLSLSFYLRLSLVLSHFRYFNSLHF